MEEKNHKSLEAALIITVFYKENKYSFVEFFLVFLPLCPFWQGQDGKNVQRKPFINISQNQNVFIFFSSHLYHKIRALIFQLKNKKYSALN